jgi:hypothetical protein
MSPVNASASRRLTFWLFPVFLGIASLSFIFRVSALEIIALAWLFFGGGYKKVHLLFHDAYCRVGFVYFSAFALLVSDLSNSTDPGTLVKGVGAYVLFPTTILFLVDRLTLSQLWVVSLSSVFCGLGSKVLFFGLSFAPENFKFGFAIPIVFALLTSDILISKRFFQQPKIRFFASMLVYFAIAFLGVWSNLRLLAFVAISTYLIVILSGILPSASFRSNKFGLFIAALAIPSFLLFISTALSLVADSILKALPPNLIHPVALSKTIEQISGDLGILFAGRHEIFSSFPAWLDKPILGWGSWAMDPNLKYDVLGKEIMVSLNYSFDIEHHLDILVDSASDIVGLIPTHSFLLNLLVWSGLLGFIPSYLFIASFVRSLMTTLSKKPSTVYPLAFLSVFALWNIFFSPFGYSNRVSATLSIAISLSWFMHDRLWVSFRNRFRIALSP